MNSKPSKSARKRETHALQNLGEQLLGLTDEQLVSIGLEVELLDAVLAARKIRAHGALRRQKQLIGKLMRHTDPDPIARALAAFSGSAREEKDIFRQAEGWRERLILNGAAELEAFYSAVGPSETLAEAVSGWQTAPNEDARRLAKRKIFRAIHRALVEQAAGEDAE